MTLEPGAADGDGDADADADGDAAAAVRVSKWRRMTTAERERVLQAELRCSGAQ